MADLAPKWQAAGTTTAQFAAMVRNFDRVAETHAEWIKDVLAANRELFYAGVIEALRTAEESRGIRFLVGLLITHDLLERVLCEPSLTLEQGVVVARLAREIDPKVELQLARRLADGFSTGETVVTANAPRLLAILAEISDGSRILPSLARLLHSSSPYLRSKAVLMIARGNRSPNWVQSRMLEGDPRVRANAIEALWGVEGESAIALLQSAARDGNNRVAGNALVGLYRLGECEVLAETVKMATHAGPQFRATAAWVMGKCADPRFREPLAQLLSDGTPMVRSQAFKALGNIKLALLLAAEGNPLRISGLLLEPSGQSARKGGRRLRLAVTKPDGLSHVRVRPIQFMVTEDGQPVLKYRVVEQPAPEAISVVFVFPRHPDQAEAEDACSKAALNCLKWKRTSDLWACLPWSPEVEGEPPSESDATLPFTGRPELLSASFSEIVRRSDCADFWHTWWHALRAGASVVRGKRHIIVVAGETVDGVGGHGLAEALDAARGRVQVVASPPNPAVESICRKTRTNCTWAGAGEGITSAIERAYLNLLARYELEYQPLSADARQVEIKIQAQDGWGEIVIPIPPPPE
jgi:hypothetical protein